jgi:hypothetical protein
MARKYFKVVRKGSAALFSSAANMWDFPPEYTTEYTTEYKVGEFVKPRVAGTRLFIFPDLLSAITFKNKHGSSTNLTIYECEAKNPQHRFIPLFAMYMIRQAWASVFNQRKKKHKLSLSGFLMSNQPVNTWTASEVKLIREIL